MDCIILQNESLSNFNRIIVCNIYDSNTNDNNLSKLCRNLFLTDAHGQENSTAILKDIQTMLNKQTSSQQKIATSPTKSATQGAYITLSVFFLGISLVVFGLRMTMKGAQNFGKYFNLMILALTVPVLVLVALYQIGIATHNRIMFYATDEPYLVISFLLYIPIGIIIFLLVSHKRMKLPQL